jgi:hypothetical protein
MTSIDSPETLFDTLEKVVIALVENMKSDFGSHYDRSYPGAEDKRQHKRRLYAQLRDKQLIDIRVAYEHYIQEGINKLPTIPQLIGLVDEAAKIRKKNKHNAEEAERMAALPPPNITRTVNPIAMLRDAIAQIAMDEQGLSKAEKWAKHQERLKAHEALIAEFESKRKLDVSGHLCATSFCGNVGTLSHGLTGGGNFYCRDHFKR